MQQRSDSMVSTKILATIVAIVIVASVGVGAVILNNQNQVAVNEQAVSNPSATPTDLYNSTINAVNSTIIAGENTTIVNPSTAPTVTTGPTTQPTATPTPTPLPTPTPPPHDFTVTYHEVERNETSVTLQFTFSDFSTGNALAKPITPGLFVIADEEDGQYSPYHITGSPKSIEWGTEGATMTYTYTSKALMPDDTIRTIDTFGHYKLKCTYMFFVTFIEI